MTRAIQIRAKLATVAAAALGLAAAEVSETRLDVVEAFPRAVVLLGPMSSERGAMGGVRDRVLALVVLVYREAAADVTSDLAGDVEAFEEAVEVARRNGEFALLCEGIELRAATVETLPDSNGKRGVVTMSYQAAYIVELPQI